MAIVAVAAGWDQASVSSPASAGDDRACRNPWAAPRALLVLALDVLDGVIRHQGGGDQAEHRAGRDVAGDRVGGVVAAEQPGRDQWRRTAGNDRRQLVAERGAAVAQPAGEAFRDQR